MPRARRSLAAITLPRHAIPGFAPTIGVTMLWVCLIVILPLASLVARPFAAGPSGALHTLLDWRVCDALRLSLLAAVAAAAIAALIGTLLAVVLARWRPPFSRLLDAMVDLPFALPTAVAGITLTTLYAPHGWVGVLLAPFGIRIAYTPAGIVLAMVFVGLPFAVRSVAPVLGALERDVEEAAATLGATPAQTARRIVLPQIAPAILSGFGLALARGIGEYGSVIFIAGNRPGVSEIAPLLIVIRLQEFNYRAAAVIGLAMLVLSAACLLAVTLARRLLPDAGPR